MAGLWAFCGPCVDTGVTIEERNEPVSTLLAINKDFSFHSLNDTLYASYLLRSVCYQTLFILSILRIKSNIIFNIPTLGDNLTVSLREWKLKSLLIARKSWAVLGFQPFLTTLVTKETKSILSVVYAELGRYNRVS